MSRDKEKLRPGQLTCFILCRQIAVRDVTIFNAPCWRLFFHGCATVSVTGVKVHNPLAAANTDGIDIDCCQYVTVSDCLIDTGNDAIAIRCNGLRLGERAQPCAYINVSNIVMPRGAVGCIRHVTLWNMRFDAVAGSRIFGDADGVIEDVAVSDCDIRIHPEEEPLTQPHIDIRVKNMLHVHGANDVRLERVRIFDEGAAQWESKSLMENCDDLVIRDCML